MFNGSSTKSKKIITVAVQIMLVYIILNYFQGSGLK